MVDFIIVAVLLVIVGAAVIYIIKAKRSGAKCIGCPAGGACCNKQKEGAGCGCGCGGEGTSDCACHADTKQ